MWRDASARLRVPGQTALPPSKPPPRKKRYGHLAEQEARRVPELEDENARLKGLVADLMLDKHTLAEALRPLLSEVAGERPSSDVTLPRPEKGR